MADAHIQEPCIIPPPPAHGSPTTPPSMILSSVEASEEDLETLAAKLASIKPGEIVTFKGDLQVWHKMGLVWMKAEDFPVEFPG